MPLLALEIPPGAYSIGTDLEASGRWLDCNLVRWRDGSLRPIGGWQERASEQTTETPRAMHTWVDNSNNRWVGMGTYAGLYVMTEGNVTTDITPAGFTTGAEDGVNNLGYGGNFFGQNFYGTPRVDDGGSDPTMWTLDNWGEYLVGVSDDDGRLWEWQLNTSNNAAQISNSPTGCVSLVVTQERFMFALGSGGNPRKISWSDQEDNTTWTAAATNQAGDFELQTPGAIKTGLRARDGVVILTDQDAHVATYIGPPLVYGFEKVGTSCGVISRQAAVSVDEGTFWMGTKAFYRYVGGGVEEILCDVHDRVFDDINETQKAKSWAVSNAEFGEIWWFYPSGNSTDCDRYVFYNYNYGYWGFGDLARQCGDDRGVFNTPIYADASGNVYEHEVGFNYGGSSPYAETGPISLGTGDQVMAATHLYPDEETQGDAQITFKTRFYPNDTERDYGPYTLANPTSVRFTGRQVRMRVDGVENALWKAGTQRLEVKARGLR